MDLCSTHVREIYLNILEGQFVSLNIIIFHKTLLQSLCYSINKKKKVLFNQSIPNWYSFSTTRCHLCAIQHPLDPTAIIDKFVLLLANSLEKNRSRPTVGKVSQQGIRCVTARSSSDTLQPRTTHRRNDNLPRIARGCWEQRHHRFHWVPYQSNMTSANEWEGSVRERKYLVKLLPAFQPRI